MLRLYAGDMAIFSNSSVHKICNILWLSVFKRKDPDMLEIHRNKHRLGEKVSRDLMSHISVPEIRTPR